MPQLAVGHICSPLRDAGNDDAKVKLHVRMGATLTVVKSMIKEEHFAKEEKVIEGMAPPSRWGWVV